MNSERCLVAASASTRASSVQAGGTLSTEGVAEATETGIRLDGSGQPSLREQANAWKDVCKGGAVEATLEDPDPRGTGIAIGRTIKLLDEKSNQCLSWKEPVWPVWVPKSGSDPTLADFEKTWANASNQARATAKWLATILGVALAALIGSAPLSGFRGEYIPWRAYVVGAAGLACIACTLFLVVSVLVPQVTDFEDLISGKRPFKNLKKRFENNTGILLPLRVHTFAELAGRMRVEALTLNMLEERINELRGDPDMQKKFDAYCNAQTGRSEWLSYLQKIATQWTVIASYQAVKYRAGWARTLGLFSGTAGTALIVVAFLMPSPQAPAANLTTYKLTHSAATTAAQSIIGESCTMFKGVVVHADSNGDLTVLVQPNDACNSASITVPGKDLMQMP
jgi:hypothetical protein